MMAVASTLSNIFDIDFTYVMITHSASETCTSLFFVHASMYIMTADNKLQGLVWILKFNVTKKGRVMAILLLQLQ